MKKNILNMLAVLLCLSVIIFNGCSGGGGDSIAVNNQQEEMMEVTLYWDAPTQYTDDTDINPGDITGYTIYYGTESGYYTGSVSLGNVTACTLTLPKNTYYFVATATDLDGYESAPSNEVSRNAQ